MIIVLITTVARGPRDAAGASQHAEWLLFVCVISYFIMLLLYICYFHSPSTQSGSAKENTLARRALVPAHHTHVRT